MRNCFLLISLLLLLSPLSSKLSALSPQPSALSSRASAQSREYNLLMNARGNDVTAIFMMNQEPDGTIVGTVVNEFGVTILDFKYTNGKAKVMNIFAPLNRWYIRKVLNKDFSFILSNIDTHENVTAGKRRLVIQTNGDIFVSNDRFKITYTLSKQAPTDETDQ